MDKKTEIKATTKNEKTKQKSFLKKYAEKHWYAPDTPQSEARFQVSNFVSWVAIYIGLPAIGFASALGIVSMSGPKKSTSSHHGTEIKLDASRSQIIDFRVVQNSGEYSAYAKKAPGTLVRVKLLNIVESGGPVFAQITDASLGRRLMGGSLLGEATSDVNLDRISINFNLVKDPTNSQIAIPIRARALSKDGTLGLNAKKKEGMLARSALGGASSLTQEATGQMESFDVRYIFMKALGTGFLNEAGNGINVEKNRASLLTLSSNIEFFAELTDFFPGSAK